MIIASKLTHASITSIITHSYLSWVVRTLMIYSLSRFQVYCWCYCSDCRLCPSLCNPMDCSMPGLSVPHHLPEFAQVHVRCIGDAIQPSYPLMPSCPLPSIFPSIRDFFSESSVHIRWPKYWSFSFSLNPSSEYSGFISLKIDWFDLLAVQGIFRSLFRHHSLVQFSRSVMPDSLWPQASLSMINFQSLLKLMSIESVMPSSHLILYCPLLLLTPIPPSISRWLCGSQ